MAKKNTRQKVTKKESKTAPINIWQGIGLGLATLFFLILPGQGYYQTLQLKTYPPQVRAGSYDDFVPSPYPIKTTSVPPPIISASAAAVIDLNSGVPLYQQAVSTRLHPASLTKLMTALISLDYYKPKDVITVSKLVTAAGDSHMGLKLGDQLTVQNLLYGLLIPSGNDAAFVLADNIPGGYEHFIDSMNSKAGELHMFHTHFSNPTGRDDTNHYTTVNDITLLARFALKEPLIAKIVATNWVMAHDVSGQKAYPLQNVNQLLSTYWGTYGVKTGFTDEAGQCLVAAAERSNRRILVVVLNSRDRFGDSTALLNWAFTNFRLTEQTSLP